MTLLIGFLVIAVVAGVVLEWRARSASGSKRARKTAHGLAVMAGVVAIVVATLLVLVLLLLGEW